MLSGSTAMEAPLPIFEQAGPPSIWPMRRTSISGVHSTRCSLARSSGVSMTSMVSSPVVRRNLTPTGRLVLATPGVFHVAIIINRWGGHGPVRYEHTCWFCEDMLERVLEVNGFSSVETSFTRRTGPTPPRKAARSVSQLLSPPRLAHGTPIAVAKVAQFVLAIPHPRVGGGHRRFPVFGCAAIPSLPPPAADRLRVSARLLFVVAFLLTVTFACGVLIAVAHVMNRRFVAPVYDVVANLTAFGCAVGASVLLGHPIPAILSGMAIVCWLVLARRTVLDRRGRHGEEQG